MATRRIVKTENDVHGKANADRIPSPAAPTKTSGSVNISSSVVTKLLLFTFAMITAPLASFYVSNTMVFKGNATAAGAIAAVVANVVLIGYIIAAIREDDTDQENAKKVQ